MRTYIDVDTKKYVSTSQTTGYVTLRIAPAEMPKITQDKSTDAYDD